MLRRRQQQVEDLGYWAELHNVDCYGGTLGKRPGTQIVNRYGSRTGVGSTATAIVCESLTGFAIGQPVRVDATMSTVASIGSTLNLTTPVPVPPAGRAVVQILSAGVPDTLFQANYRDQTKRLYAAILGTPRV